MSGFLTWIQSAIYNLVVPLLPNSLQELLLFIVTVVLVIIIIDLFVYTNIQRRIKNDSRCYQENKKNLASSDYTVYVKTVDGNIIGSINYNKITRTTTWQDVCNEKLDRTLTNNGSSSSGIPIKIKYFEYNHARSPPVYQQEKDIRCPISWGTLNPNTVIYTGGPEDFRRFTQHGTPIPSFFTEA